MDGVGVATVPSGALPLPVHVTHSGDAEGCHYIHSFPPVRLPIAATDREAGKVGPGGCIEAPQCGSCSPHSRHRAGKAVALRRRPQLLAITRVPREPPRGHLLPPMRQRVLLLHLQCLGVGILIVTQTDSQSQGQDTDRDTRTRLYRFTVLQVGGSPALG